MIHIIIGTRAQLFKMAPIMLECQRNNLNWRWVYTAQHQETIENTINSFDLPKPSHTVFKWQDEAKTMGKLWYWFLRVILKLFRYHTILGGYVGSKNIVLTHGDTITTWWGALVGRLGRCKVMHVESGLRSFNIWRPFPEEINRLITFKLSNFYACPGDWACNNLKNYKGEKINTVHNTQIDMLNIGLKKLNQANIKLPHEKYVVASIHRYENIFKSERFNDIVNYLENVSAKFKVLFILHPATSEQLIKLGLKNRMLKNPNIDLKPRLNYLDFVKLIKHSEFVISDGGGNQEELYVMGKPVLLFRSETERQEGIGSNVVLSMFDDKIILNFLNNYKKYVKKPIINFKSPSKTIVQYLKVHDYGN